MHHSKKNKQKNLVLIHGWGMNAAVWTPLLPLLSSFNVTLVELPGHGDAPWIENCTSLNQWAEAALAQAPPAAIWCAWSLGGQVALQAAIMQPERIAGLMLVASTPRFTQAFDWTHAVAVEVLQQFSAALMQNPQTTLNRFLTLQVGVDVEAKKTLLKLKSSMQKKPTPNKQALAVGLALLLNNDLRSKLPQMNKPVLWLLGSKDTLVPATMQQDLKKITNASVAVINNAAHAPFLSHPQKCLDLLDGFSAHV